MTITEAAVRTVASRCLVPSDSPDAVPVTLRAMAVTVYVNRDHLRKNKAEITNLLEDLPNEFRGPLGASVEQLNVTKDGQTWTTDQPTLVALLVLGAGLGLLTVSEQFDLTNDLRYVLAVRIV